MNTKNIKQKLFSKKVFGVPAFLVALAVMSVGGIAVMAFYGTSTATFTVAQSITVNPTTYSFTGIIQGDTKTYNMSITNAANNPITVVYTPMAGFPDGTTATPVMTTNGIAVVYIGATTIPALSTEQITVETTFAQDIDLGNYNVTTTVAPYIAP